MSESLPEVYLARHGETAWTISRQHTGKTDIPLTDRGERNALSLGERLRRMSFAKVLVSPLQRARRTSELAGLVDRAEVDPDLMEWDYGEYEGRKTADIQKERPDWYLWRDGVPGGESIAQVGERARKVIARALTAGGDVALFGHGHILRIVASCWLDLPPEEGKHLALGTAGVGMLGFEHDTHVIERWNC